jgi:hypothetical protein
MRWKKDFPFRWLRKKQSVVSDVCGLDSSQYELEDIIKHAKADD